jgi:hypothetical protein
MNRVMGPLLVVVAVLVAGANAGRLLEALRWLAASTPGALSALTARGAALGAMVQDAARSAGGLDVSRAGLALALGLAVAAFLFAVCGIGLELGRRGPRREVLSMARRGRATAEIARRTRLSQDAVRTLLRPGRDGTRLHA